MLLSINEVTTYRWSFDEDVRRYCEAGIGAIGVWRHKLSDLGEPRGIECLAESGLAVSSLFWAGGFTGHDGRSYRESIEDAVEAIRLAATINAGCLVVHTGPRGGHTLNHVRRLVLGALQELAGVADDLDVALAIEPMHESYASEWTFLTNVNQALDLLSDVGSSRFGLVLDTYHFGLQPELLDWLEAWVNCLALVHLADTRGLPSLDQQRCCLGAGSVPLFEIVTSLQQLGYEGYLEVELVGDEIESSAYDRLLAESLNAFQQLTGGG